MKNYLLPATLALLLAACGGGGNDSPPAVAAGPVAVDAFTALVQSQYMDQSDTADVQAIDTVSLSTSETTEPMAI